jgi:hypothetical protein
MKLTEKKRVFRLQPIYRVGELAMMLGLSKRILLRKLQARGVAVQPADYPGGACMVTLVAIRTGLAEEWESMMLVRALEGG